VVGAGAKILGPLNVGEKARVGSNSVVLKDVPDSATVVGIPARIVTSETTAADKSRETIAKKIGFDAYGGTQEMPDPVAYAFNSVLDHLAKMDQRQEDMCRGLRSLGAEVADMTTPELSELKEKLSAVSCADQDESESNANGIPINQ